MNVELEGASHDGKRHLLVRGAEGLSPEHANGQEGNIQE